MICGDWNIAHREIDVKNWKSNRDTTGFLPRFTWWVQWAKARERNVGWRIDYQIATPGLAAKAKKAVIYTKEIFSDHAPVVVDYDWEA